MNRQELTGWDRFSQWVYDAESPWAWVLCYSLGALLSAGVVAAGFLVPWLFS